MTTRSYKQGLTKSMIIVNSLFVISQLCNGVRRIYVATVSQKQSAMCEHPYQYVNALAMIALSINSSANFFVFVLFNNHFKKQVKKVWIFIRAHVNRVGIEEVSESAGQLSSNSIK